jgi:methylamine dehydrogenase heavy chain
VGVQGAEPPGLPSPLTPVQRLTPPLEPPDDAAQQFGGRGMKLGYAGAVIAALALPAGAAELAAETPHVQTLAPSNGHRLYVQDIPPAHAVDGRIHILDGDNWRVLGQLPNGFFGLMALSGDGSTLYNATTYFSRGDHGTRTDVVELFDTTTLALQGEIALPPQRAQSTAHASYMAESAGGTYLFIQGATPASSVIVVDLTQRRVLAQYPTAGCFGIYPSSAVAGRFSTLCGDGAAVTVSFDTTGRETERKRSEKLFDPVGDALFITGVPGNGKDWFVSFLGNVHAIDFSGPAATQEKPWPLVTGDDAAQGWRPGGAEVVAFSEATGQLYVGMHAHGKEGSHKTPAEAIWRVDVASHAGKPRGLGPGATVLAVSAGAHPVLFTADGDIAALSRFDGDTLKQTGNSNSTGVEYGETLVVR